MTQMFYPEPGDTIVCKNGELYLCVEKSDYKYTDRYPDSVIYGISHDAGGEHMNWKSNDGRAEYETGYDIVEIRKTGRNGYTAGQVVRAVESLGFEIPVTDILIALKYADDPDYKTFRELKKKFEGV